MCAGLQFPLDRIERIEFDHFLLPGEFEGKKKGGSFQVFYWDKQPFLPIEENGGVHLYSWGNRDGELKLPKTGWARIESLRDGRWDVFSPHQVLIPCDFGYEKKKWFKTPGGLTGVKVRWQNVDRVYILTQKADQQFLNYTGHDRMPVMFADHKINR
jgi:hypothetical protein